MSWSMLNPWNLVRPALVFVGLLSPLSLRKCGQFLPIDVNGIFEYGFCKAERYGVPPPVLTVATVCALGLCMYAYRKMPVRGVISFSLKLFLRHYLIDKGFPIASKIFDLLETAILKLFEEMNSDPKNKKDPKELADEFAVFLDTKVLPVLEDPIMQKLFKYDQKQLEAFLEHDAVKFLRGLGKKEDKLNLQGASKSAALKTPSLKEFMKEMMTVKSNEKVIAPIVKPLSLVKHSV